VEELAIMTPTRFARRHHAPRRAPAFSLVELLTVIFIISALIAILVPSLSAARNQAKKTVTKKAIDSIKMGLEAFKNDHEKDFRRTNGYPPSFEYPKLSGVAFEPYLGQFPFLPKDPPVTPVVYGAQWLPAMLVGVDAQGYIARREVPPAFRDKPNAWYNPNLLPESPKRSPLYVDPGGINLVATNNLPGKRPEPPLFPDWKDMQDMPVMADAFDYPILYYVSNTAGKPTNMVAAHRDKNNVYNGGDQEVGVPYYFHEDNAGFTGDDENEGWNFQGVDHPMRKSGAKFTGDMLLPDYGGFEESFARRIVDRPLYRELKLKDEADRKAVPLRPVNHDSYLLISPGADGLYGTNDDVSNIPPFID